MLPFVTKSFQELCPGDFIHFEGVSTDARDLLLVDGVAATKLLQSSWVASVFTRRGDLLYLTAPQAKQIRVLDSTGDPPGWESWDPPLLYQNEWVAGAER